VSVLVRAATLAAAVLAVAAGGAFLVIHYLLGGPPVEAFTAHGGAVSVTLQEDPQNSVTSKPDWVSYFIKSPDTGQWVHTTLFQVPAGTTVHVTILGYDGCTPLRNPYWGKVTGTKGNVEDVNGKPVSQINSWSGCNVGHTFSIPGIGLNVPMASPSLTASLCANSPCTKGPHTVVQFTFTTPRVPGDYFWQCRVPCGGGFLDGFGGPMQTIGFMTGNMEVVS
jgi:hypothetical protein